MIALQYVFTTVESSLFHVNSGDRVVINLVELVKTKLGRKSHM